MRKRNIVARNGDVITIHGIESSNSEIAFAVLCERMQGQRINFLRIVLKDNPAHKFGPILCRKQSVDLQEIPLCRKTVNAGKGWINASKLGQLTNVKCKRECVSCTCISQRSLFGKCEHATTYHHWDTHLIAVELRQECFEPKQLAIWTNGSVAVQIAVYTDKVGVFQFIVWVAPAAGDRKKSMNNRELPPFQAAPDIAINFPLTCTTLPLLFARRRQWPIQREWAE